MAGGREMLAALDEGPARMSGPDVAASQRRRMLAAMVAVVAEKGYVAVAVADVVARARVSRATFYDQFRDKTDCFVAALQACTDQLVRTLHERAPRRLAARDRLPAFLDAYLTGLAAFPEGARVCLVEMYAVGPEAARQRHGIQLAFAGVLREMHAELAATGEPVRPLSDFDFEALVGAVSALATNRVATGGVAELPALRAPLETFVLTHFGLEGPQGPPR